VTRNVTPEKVTSMFKAKLLKLNALIEEEVFLEINGIKFLGFSTICPYKISPNSTYPVNLYFTFLDGPEVLNDPHENHQFLSNSC